MLVLFVQLDFDLVDLVKLRAPFALAEQDPSAEPPRQHSEHLVPGVSSCGDGEDVVELLKGPLLRLGHEQENQHQSNDVERGVKSKGSRCSERLQHTGERER